MKKSDLERLKKVLTLWDALHAQIVSRDLSKEELLHDEFAQWAVTTPVYNIGEQVYQLSPELKKQYPAIPWNMVAGLRHRLVHDYEGINWSIIADVIYEDMPLFAQSVAEVITQLNQSSTVHPADG